MIRKSLLAVVAVLFAGSLAFAQQTTYNFDRGTDFTKLKTYKWVPIKGAQHPDAITDKNIVTIIDAQLAAKGLVKKDADPVDLFVGYGTTVEQEKMITGYGGGFGFRFGGMGMAETSTINNGTILIDIYAVATKTLAWRGNVTEAVPSSSDPNKNYKQLEKAITKLMKDFPPPPAK
jgi:hypothetical protein